MIVSFLQMKQSVSEHTGIRPSWNLGTLLVEFFQYYGVKFNYFHAGISINENGRLFEKQDWYKQAQNNPSTPGGMANTNSNGKGGNLNK